MHREDDQMQRRGKTFKNGAAAVCLPRGADQKRVGRHCIYFERFISSLLVDFMYALSVLASINFNPSVVVRI